MAVHVCNLVQEVETRSQKVKVIHSYIVGSSPTWDTQDEVSKRDAFNWKIRTIHSRHGWWLTPVILVPRRLKQGTAPSSRPACTLRWNSISTPTPQHNTQKHHIYKPTRELITCDKKKWMFVESIHITEWGQQARVWRNPPHFKCPTWQCPLFHFTGETNGGSRAMGTGRGWWEGSAGEIPYWVGSLEGRELIPNSWPLTTTWLSWHMDTHTQ